MCECVQNGTGEFDARSQAQRAVSHHSDHGHAKKTIFGARRGMTASYVASKSNFESELNSGTQLFGVVSP